MMCSCSHLYNFVLLKNSISVTKKSRAAMIMISNCQWTICVVGGGALRIIITICPNFYICWEKLILSNPNTKPSEDAPSPCIYTPSLCTFIKLRNKQVDIKKNPSKSEQSTDCMHKRSRKQFFVLFELPSSIL